MLNIFIGIAACCVIGYLLGSLSGAIIVSKTLRHEDIRTHGSGNAGMTNVLRTYGKKLAALCAVADILKGIAAVLIARWVMSLLGVTELDGAYPAGLFVLVGHLFPLYFGFKGGKGVLTSASVAAIINPLAVIPCLAAYGITVKLSGISSLSSLIASAMFPVATLVVRLVQGRPFILDTLFAVLLAGAIIWMHRSNIKRLIKGEEHSFKKKK